MKLWKISRNGERELKIAPLFSLQGKRTLITHPFLRTNNNRYRVKAAAYFLWSMQACWHHLKDFFLQNIWKAFFRKLILYCIIKDFHIICRRGDCRLYLVTDYLVSSSLLLACWVVGCLLFDAINRFSYKLFLYRVC